MKMFIDLFKFFTNYTMQQMINFWFITFFHLLNEKTAINFVWYIFLNFLREILTYLPRDLKSYDRNISDIFHIDQ